MGYLFPSVGRNVAAVDSFTVSHSPNMPLLFQITVGGSHELMLHGMDVTGRQFRRYDRNVFTLPKGSKNSAFEAYSGSGTLSLSDYDLFDRKIHELTSEEAGREISVESIEKVTRLIVCLLRL